MFKGKVALVTGGSRGIGACITKKLASLGADVAVIYAGNEEMANEVCAYCTDTYGVNAKAYKCNVADFNEAKETVAKVKEEMGTIDYLVNNAGITKDKLIAMMREGDFDDVVDVNLKGTFNMIKHCSGVMIRNKGGKIVNISSVSGLMGNAGQANYSATKAAIVGLTKSVAKELAGRNITCNAVAPGFIATDMTKDLIEAQNELISQIPLGHVGQPEDVADAIAFLLTSDYITGEVIRVDGGIAM